MDLKFKKQLQVLQDEEQKISSLCQNKEVILHNLQSKQQDLKQKITEVVGTLDHSHIPIQIHSYKKPSLNPTPNIACCKK